MENLFWVKSHGTFQPDPEELWSVQLQPGVTADWNNGAQRLISESLTHRS